MAAASEGRSPMATAKAQEDETPETSPERQPAEPRTKLAKIGRVTSRGKEYTTVWLPREVGEQLEKGARYAAELGGDGVLVLRPAGPEETDKR
jgi:hypothetical protein